MSVPGVPPAGRSSRAPHERPVGLVPHLSTRRTRLQAATRADLARFADTTMRTGIESVRTPAAAPMRMPEAAFVVTRRTDGEYLGFTTLHGLDTSGHIRCGIYLDPRTAQLGIGAEVVHMTLNYAFATFPVRKVIAQTTEASFASFGVGRNDRTEAAVLVGHLYFRGQSWDLYTFEVGRREWDQMVYEYSDAYLPPGSSWRPTAPNSTRGQE